MLSASRITARYFKNGAQAVHQRFASNLTGNVSIILHQTAVMPVPALRHDHVGTHVAWLLPSMTVV